ncbi:Activator of Hsp90 ATPase homolog 1-like protein [Bacillus sp. UNCCL81]|nr:Activator of Hsp90 ATPase homolog 1-like protein [Bacillus sp. UNCCL81]
METSNKVTVKVTIKVSIEKVWEFWTEPEHIKKWNSPSDD